MNLSEAIFEYCASERFLFLDDKLKGHAEQLLAQWVTTVDDDLDFDTLDSSVNGIVTLDLPIDAKRSFPDLLDAFFDYLTTTAAWPDAPRWQDYLAEISLSYSDRIRDDGSFKGQTVSSALKVGRNDPCPCGSGRKYKKCCG